MTKSATYFSIIEACQKDGCPLCRVEQEAVLKFIDTLFYEQINELEMRERLRKSLGLCHEHDWLAADGMTGIALGLAILYDDMQAALKIIEDGQTDEIIRETYSHHRHNPKIKWKKGIKKIVGIPLAIKPGMDI